MHRDWISNHRSCRPCTSNMQNSAWSAESHVLNHQCWRSVTSYVFWGGFLGKQVIKGHCACAGGAAGSADYVRTQYAAQPEVQNATSRWSHSYGQDPVTFTSQGQGLQSPSDAGQASSWSGTAQPLPWAVPSEALVAEAWTTAQDQIEAAVAATMNALRQPDWAVSPRHWL